MFFLIYIGQNNFMNLFSLLQLITKIALILLFISLCFFAYRLIFIIIGFIKDKPLKETNKKGKFAILIPARNESKVIEKLFESIKNQTYDKNFIDVFVVTENEDDPTNFITKRYGYNFFVRKDLKNKRTKGYALNEVVEDIYNKELKYDAFFIFDADNVLAPNFIEEMNKAYQAGYPVATAYRNIVNIHDNWVSTCSALLFSNINTFQNKARSRITKNIIISGTGYYISSKILDSFRGFPFTSLTEDFEISNYLILKNIKTKYVTSTEFFDEQPTSIKTINNQRTRWCRGYFDVSKKYRKPLLKEFFKKGSNKKAILDVKFSIVPNILFILSFIIYSIILALFLVFGIISRNFIIVDYCFSCLFNLFLVYYLLLGLYTFLLLKAEKNKFNLTFKEKFLTIFFNPFFINLFIYQAAKAIFSKNIVWKEIKHTSKEVVIEKQIDEEKLELQETLEVK